MVSAISPSDSRELVSDSIIDKFALSGSAAEAVEELFARPADSAIGVLSVVLLVFSGVSLSRRLQRMYLQAWELEPLRGVRGSINAALGLAVLLVEIALLSLVRTLVGDLPVAWVLGAPTSIVASLVLWTSVPWLLLDRRIPWRRLLPAGVLTAAGASVYGVATTIYMPRMMQSNSEQYGLFGVTLSLYGWLLCVALIVVAATVVAAEFDRAPEPWARHLRTRLGIEPATRSEGDPEPADRPTVDSSGDRPRA